MSTTFRFTPKSLAVLIAFLGLIAAHWIFAAGLKSPPSGIDALEDLDLASIKGGWHEIARMPNDLEAGFGQTLLTLKSDDENIINLTLTDPKNPKQSWEGTADYEDESPSSALISCALWLKCGYHVVALDKRQHLWFIVVGHNFDQVWLFAREPGLDQDLLQKTLTHIAELGFDRDRLEIHNEPRKAYVAPQLNKPIKPKNPTADPYAVLPQEPANLPPIPSQIPEAPTDIPAVPRDIPAIPKDMPTPNWNPVPMP